MKNNTVKITAFLLELASKLGVFIVSFILARVYAPDDFGTWSYIQTLVFFTIILVEYSCHQNGIRLILTSSDKEKAWLIVQLCKLTGFLILLLVLVVLTFYSDNAYFFFAVLIYGLGVFFNQDYYFRSKGLFLIAAIQNFLMIGSLLLLSLLVFYVYVDPFFLAEVRSFIYLLVSVVFLFFYSERIIYKVQIFKYGVLKLVFKDYYDCLKSFSFVLVGAVLARSISLTPVFLIKEFESYYELGLFQSILLFYLGFITFKGVVLTQVYPKLCSLYADGVYFRYVKKLSLSFLPVLFVLFAFVFNFGYELILLCFGPDYISDDTLSLFKIVCIICFISSVTFFISSYFHVSGKSREFFTIMLFCSVMGFAFNVILIKNFSIVGAGYALLISESLVIFCSLFFYRAGFLRASNQ